MDREPELKMIRRAFEAAHGSRWRHRPSGRGGLPQWRAKTSSGPGPDRSCAGAAVSMSYISAPVSATTRQFSRGWSEPRGV
jgi:hypothetical protein